MIFLRIEKSIPKSIIFLCCSKLNFALTKKILLWIYSIFNMIFFLKNSRNFALKTLWNFLIIFLSKIFNDFLLQHFQISLKMIIFLTNLHQFFSVIIFIFSILKWEFLTFCSKLKIIVLFLIKILFKKLNFLEAICKYIILKKKAIFEWFYSLVPKMNFLRKLTKFFFDWKMKKTILLTFLFL